jgi:hypothetical protein|tara:strand:+ start:255 stop:503 length:249 start_codon:yes stop_codon:yes gene_type:complete
MTTSHKDIEAIEAQLAKAKASVAKELSKTSSTWIQTGIDNGFFVETMSKDRTYLNFSGNLQGQNLEGVQVKKGRFGYYIELV